MNIHVVVKSVKLLNQSGK